MRIAIVGTGYVGLVSGACLAELGHEVICIDNDPSKIDALNNGRIPIYEPGLDELVSRNAKRGTLRFSLDLAESVKGREAVFIAVGTPSHPGTDRADLSYVMAVAEQVAPNIDKFTVLVTKSTVPVGTNREVQRVAERCLALGQSFAVASNPEFLREGSAIQDFMHPDRVVFGTDSEAAADIMRRIYAPLAQNGCEVLATEIETAEVIKYAANAFLAVKISYINEIADLCEVVGADVDRVAAGIGLDRRIGAAFLKAGPGWGGSCFPKDTRALKATASKHNLPMRIVEAAIEANSNRKTVMFDKIQAACGGSVAGKRLAVFGLTFKGQTDDMRESPSVSLIQMLEERGAKVRAYDPSGPADAARILPTVRSAEGLVGTVHGADALIILTDWEQFKEYDLSEMAAYMADPVMIDLRNLFDEYTVRKSGFRQYVRIGRKATAERSTPSPEGREDRLPARLHNAVVSKTCQEVAASLAVDASEAV
ncbi:UDP-glucose/GDP-mannose dehydrogenase family protein [Caballeronia sp. EK]|nr:UDP-glucose/GDP-mannose dehydrogenase family protein [Caballeronia sp. EK]